MCCVMGYTGHDLSAEKFIPPAFAGEQRAGLVRRNGSGGQIQIRDTV